MDKETILNALSATLDANLSVRKAAEEQLKQCEEQPGFTSYCLSLAVDPSVANHLRSSASIYFKNRVAKFWGLDDPRGIREAEQMDIKANLINGLLATVNDQQVRPQLVLSVRSILRSGWVLIDVIMELLKQGSDEAHVFTGLLLLKEVCKSLRWSYQDRTAIDDIIAKTYPILESLVPHFLNQADVRSSELLYFVLKIFKYGSLNVMPQYFHDVNHLQTWIQIHLTVVQREQPQDLIGLDDNNDDDFRLKTFKWGFGNLQRFYSRFGAEVGKNSTAEFVEFFNKSIVPEILKVYFPIIEKWNSGIKLSNHSLYFLIEFLERCINTTSWDLIKPHLELIMRYLILPCLCQEDLSLFEDDPEEYIRRYFDINRESKTCDVASVDFLFVLSHKRKEEIPLVLNISNEIINEFNASPSQVKLALKAEGGLRMLSSIAFSMCAADSPFYQQVDQIIDHLILPQLSSSYEFLRARACETISIFAYDFKDKQILLKVFESVYINFKQSENLPIKIESADALRVLVTQQEVINILAPEVPNIMKSLLELSRNYELDLLGEVMETFVEVFADELEPFGQDLGKQLVEQFLRVAQEFMELQNVSNSKDEINDKEYQAVGLINTMITVTISMKNVSFDGIFSEVIKFVLNNASLSFLVEALELLETLSLSCKDHLTPMIWELFNDCIGTFDTFALDFFEYYLPFFENIILYGFKGLQGNEAPVQQLNQVILTVLSSDLESEINGAIELVEYETLMFKQLNELFPKCLEVFVQNDLPPYSFVKLLLASLYVNATQTLGLLESSNQTIRVFEIWFNLSSSFENAYGLKLQIIALLSVLCVDQLPESLSGFVGQLGLKVINCIQELPAAIKRRNATLSHEETETGVQAEAAEFEEEEYDEDAFRSTPIDDLNAFTHFKTFFTRLQQTHPDRHGVIVGALTPEQSALVQAIMAA